MIPELQTFLRVPTRLGRRPQQKLAPLVKYQALSTMQSGLNRCLKPTIIAAGNAAHVLTVRPVRYVKMRRRIMLIARGRSKAILLPQDRQQPGCTQAVVSQVHSKVGNRVG